MIRAVVFDLDHTLFDRYATLRKIAPAFCRDFGGRLCPGLSEEEVAEKIVYADRHYMHFEWERLFQGLSELGLFQDPPTWEEYRDYIRGQFMKVAVPFAFVPPTLDTLRRMGCRLGLITNGGEKLQRRKLEMLGLENCFDQVLITGAFGVDKPALEPFYAMAEWLAMRPEELMYVGDNPINDIAPSRKAGYTPVWVRTTGIWVTPEIEKPALQVDTVAELPALLEKNYGLHMRV